MFAEVNHIGLYYEEHGKGLPLVLLHGYPLDHTIWDGVVSRLQSQARVITPDLRGHGLSDAPQGPYTMRLMASDVAALLDRLEIQQVVLAGHSMGGYISLAFAQAYPDRLLGLGMISSQAAADTPESKAARYKTARAVEKDGVGVVAESMPSRLTSQPAYIARLHELILKMKPAGVIGDLQGIAERAELSEWISQMCLPTAVIAGDADALVPLARAREMAAKMPNAVLTVIQGAGHMPMLEAPVEVAAALAGLVQTVVKGMGQG